MAPAFRRRLKAAKSPKRCVGVAKEYGLELNADDIIKVEVRKVSLKILLDEYTEILYQ